MDHDDLSRIIPIIPAERSAVAFAANAIAATDVPARPVPGIVVPAVALTAAEIVGGLGIAAKHRAGRVGAREQRPALVRTLFAWRERDRQTGSDLTDGACAGPIGIDDLEDLGAVLNSADFPN